MFPLLRTLLYGVAIGGFIVVYVPGQILEGSTIPAVFGSWQVAGIFVGTAGAFVAVWCAVLFAIDGRGTPVPLDPPRRLVTTGPYRVSRNPMATGVVVLLAGMALYYESWGIAAYAGGLFVLLSAFIMGVEEPRLSRDFGEEYAEYRRRVGRWGPRLRR